MAKYQITAGCGHTVEQQLYGSTKERDRRIGWMESPSGMCNPCYAAHKRAEEAAAEESEIDALVARLREQAPTAEQLATLKVQFAEGAGSDVRRKAFERYLAEIEG